VGVYSAPYRLKEAQVANTAEKNPMAGSTELPADPRQATEEANEEQSTDPRNAAVPKLTPTGLPVAESVIEAGISKHHGFPIDTLEGRIMATSKNADGTVTGEDGTDYERSEDMLVWQPAGTAEKNQKAAAKADESQKSTAKS
jgi:hypothetical protein